MFLFPNDKLYDEWNVKRPLPILNECIQKRYRENGYQVVYVLYPDKDIFGVIPKAEDRIIYTDILFSENSGIDENGETKIGFVPKYPNEQLLIEKLGNVRQLVIGGYHYSDCVKKVGETALKYGIDTIVDLDMTDLFFSLYRKEDYFHIEEYSPQRYKEYIYNQAERYGESLIEKKFSEAYSSEVYGFRESSTTRKK